MPQIKQISRTDISAKDIIGAIQGLAIFTFLLFTIFLATWFNWYFIELLSSFLYGYKLIAHASPHHYPKKRPFN